MSPGVGGPKVKTPRAVDSEGLHTRQLAARAEHVRPAKRNTCAGFEHTQHTSTFRIAGFISTMPAGRGRSSKSRARRLLLVIGCACLVAIASAQSGASSWDFRGAADVQAARQQASADSNFHVFSNKVAAMALGGGGPSINVGRAGRRKLKIISSAQQQHWNSAVLLVR